MSPFTFETVWPNPPQHIRDEVVDFWRSEGVLTYGQAVERAAQLVVVVRHHTGAVAGVSTAIPTFVERLALPCYYFRSFIGKAYRAEGLRSTKVIHQLLRRSYDALNAEFQRDRLGGAVGLYMEIENATIQRVRNELVWTDLDANVVFVGVLPNGNHARVWYFENARIPPVP